MNNQCHYIVNSKKTYGSTRMNNCTSRKNNDGSVVSLAIKPHAVYDLQNQFKKFRDLFVGHETANQIDVSFDLEDNLSVAYWDINALQTEVFQPILNSIATHASKSGEISIQIQKKSNYAVFIKISGVRKEAVDDTQVEVVHNHILQSVQHCLFAHKGSVRFEKKPEVFGIHYHIEIPLYDLCIQ